MRLLGSKYSLAAWLHLAVRVAWFLSIVGLVILGVFAIFVLRWDLLADADSSSVLVYLGPALAPGSDFRGEATTVRAIGDTFSDPRLRATTGRIEFSPRSPVMVGLSVVSTFVLYALYMLVLHRLKAITATLAGGRPFTPENAARIRTIGLAIVLWWAVDIASRIADQVFAARHFAVDDASLSAWFVPFDLPILFLGLLVLVLGGVFLVGARLQEDQDATI